MMRWLIYLLLGMPLSGMAEPAASWGLPQLMKSLAQTKESRGTFVESKYLSVLNRPLESSGTLFFQAPGHLEKHTLKPREENLVLDSGMLNMDSKARNIKRTLVLQEQPAVWALVESMRSTLAGDQATLERFYRVELQGGEARWMLKLLPLERGAREVIREIRIEGRGGRITRIETLESNGDHAVMIISEVGS